MAELRSRRVRLSPATLVVLGTLPLGAARCPELPNRPLPEPPPVIGGEGEGEGDVGGVPEVALAIEAAIAEKLQCEELLRPSTIARIRDVLHDPTLDGLRALLLAPEDLASVVALAGPEVEGSVILVHNLVLLTQNPVARGVIEEGWDSVECGDPITVGCTAGTETTTLACAGDVVQSVTVAFDGCTLDGVVRDGAFTLARDASDSSAALLRFEALTFDEIELWQGALLVDVGAGPDAFAASIGGAELFEIVEHGGVSAGLECSAETRFRTAALAVDGGVTTVQLDVQKQDTSKTIGIATFGDHLRFEGTDCGCPVAGSGVVLDVPRPLGRDGETAHARVTWSASADPALCADANVELLDWPTTCDVVTDVAGDCAQGATATVLAELLTSLCTR